MSVLAPSVGRMDMKLELVAVPVTDVDRAKEFYVRAGFHADHDHTVSEEVRFVQLTPPGSACSIAIGKGLTTMTPGSLDNLQAVVADADAMVELSVEDEGPGIPEANLENIFDRFYSERPKGEKFGQHSGLGLSISRQIVEALHGRISAENRKGPDGRTLGARFIVRLPKA